MDWTAIATFAIPILVALVTGYVSVRVAKNRSQSDIKIAKEQTATQAQEKINEGFQLLVTSLEERLRTEREEYRKDREAERAAFAAERKHLQETIENLKNEVMRLNRRVRDLTREMKTHGLEIPEEIDPRREAAK